MWKPGDATSSRGSKQQSIVLAQKGMWKPGEATSSRSGKQQTGVARKGMWKPAGMVAALNWSIFRLCLAHGASVCVRVGSGAVRSQGQRGTRGMGSRDRQGSSVLSGVHAPEASAHSFFLHFFLNITKSPVSLLGEPHPLLTPFSTRHIRGTERAALLEALREGLVLGDRLLVKLLEPPLARLDAGRLGPRPLRQLRGRVGAGWSGGAVGL